MLPFRKILCPVDFSEPSYSALAAANEMALHHRAELFVMHVVQPIPVATSPAGGVSSFDVNLYQSELNESAERSLQEIVAEKIDRSLAAQVVIGYGDAADEIVRVVEREDIDLIVIATHGRTGWRRVFFGSVVEKVVRIAPRPVLTIQARRADHG